MNKATALGEKLRQLRRERGWTLQTMADRCGLSISTLSKVENHKISLTYDSLTKLAEGMELDVSELFSDTPTLVTSNRRSVARQESASRLETRNYDYFYVCQELRHKKMIPIITRVKTRSIEEFGDMLSHSGEEFIFVISGAIEVHSAHYEPLRLEVGEGVYIDSTMPHAYLCASEDEALVLGVCSSPESVIELRKATLAREAKVG